jgi:hypothetical protein
LWNNRSQNSTLLQTHYLKSVSHRVVNLVKLNNISEEENGVPESNNLDDRHKDIDDSREEYREDKYQGDSNLKKL